MDHGIEGSVINAVKHPLVPAEVFVYLVMPVVVSINVVSINATFGSRLMSSCRNFSRDTLLLTLRIIHEGEYVLDPRYLCLMLV